VATVTGLTAAVPRLLWTCLAAAARVTSGLTPNSPAADRTDFSQRPSRSCPENPFVGIHAFWHCTTIEKLAWTTCVINVLGKCSGWPALPPFANEANQLAQYNQDSRTRCGRPIRATEPSQSRVNLSARLFPRSLAPSMGAIMVTAAEKPMAAEGLSRRQVKSSAACRLARRACCH
jgi:hypothetical protein